MDQQRRSRDVPSDQFHACRDTQPHHARCQQQCVQHLPGPPAQDACSDEQQRPGKPQQECAVGKQGAGGVFFKRRQHMQIAEQHDEPGCDAVQ